MAEQCGLCGDPMSRNPHPEAGTPSKLLEVGATFECIPCLVRTRHHSGVRAEQAWRRANRLEEAISDALLALGTGNCKLNQCEGCKEDEHAAREGLKAVLVEEDITKQVCTLTSDDRKLAKKVWEGGHGHSIECTPSCRLQEGNTDA